MLSAKRGKCPYCLKTLFPYVYMEELETKTAIFTQCFNPKCALFIDIWVVNQTKVQALLDDLIGSLEGFREEKEDKQLMNKRQQKKADKKELAKAIRYLWEFQPKGDEPCDDFSCGSCYVQIDYQFY